MQNKITKTRSLSTVLRRPSLNPIYTKALLYAGAIALAVNGQIPMNYFGVCA